LSERGVGTLACATEKQPVRCLYLAIFRLVYISAHAGALVDLLGHFTLSIGIAGNLNFGLAPALLLILLVQVRIDLCALGRLPRAPRPHLIRISPTSGFNGGQILFEFDASFALAAEFDGERVLITCQRGFAALLGVVLGKL